MKKALFATTALVATAGVASAEIEISGWAEMGIIGGDGLIFTQSSTLNGDAQFHSDLDIDFNMSGVADNGLEYGATIDLDEAGVLGNGNGDTFTNATAWISGSWGTLTLGDTDGAFDWALTEVGMGTSITDDHTSHVGYNGNSVTDATGNGAGQILRYDNTFAGGFGLALSIELDDDANDDDVFQIGFKYDADLGGIDLGIGLGYAETAGADAHGISLSAGFGGGFSAVLNYSDFGGGFDHTGVGFGYESGPLLVHVNWGEYSSGGASIDGYGVAVNYDFGGGLAAQFGYGSDMNPVAAGSQEQWSLGLAMSF